MHEYSQVASGNGIVGTHRGGAYAPESVASSLRRATASGCGTATAAASLPLLACMGNSGIGGTAGISSRAPLSLSASTLFSSSLSHSASAPPYAPCLLSPPSRRGGQI